MDPHLAVVEASQMDWKYGRLRSYLAGLPAGGMPLSEVRDAARNIIQGVQYLQQRFGRTAVIDADHILVSNQIIPGRRTKFFLLYSEKDPSPDPEGANVGAVGLGLVMLQMRCGEVIPANVQINLFLANLEKLLARKIEKNKTVNTIPSLGLITNADLFAAEMENWQLKREAARLVFYMKNKESSKVNHKLERKFMVGIQQLFSSDRATVVHWGQITILD